MCTVYACKIRLLRSFLHTCTQQTYSVLMYLLPNPFRLHYGKSIESILIYVCIESPPLKPQSPRPGIHICNHFHD